ncbi:putative organic cation transporter protein-like [Apostichopus japonicus]|uniref:Putative organic cation transporter protein-like n=1 Tax=Stichopus japonicus TaxID=307972 RepID=A0A2G8JQ26_STIJA|nr:putative organic cation transporter protein-like [Apostichopus japonicus]
MSVVLEAKDLDSHCVKYNLTGIKLTSAFKNHHLLKYLDVIPCDQGWNFDRSVYRSTITEDWELVCGQSSSTNILQSVTFAGRLAGCILFGYLADRIGRRYTITVSTVLTGFVCVLCAASPNVIIFGILRFIVDGLAYGATLVCFVLGTEVILPEVRVYFGVILWFCFALGYFVVAAVGRYIENWRIQLLLFAIPYFAAIPFLFFLTESPRWLLSKRNYYKAEKAIKKIAIVNGKYPPAAFMTKLREVKEDTKRNVAYCDMFRHRTLTYYMINLMYNWFVQSFVYYGLSLGTSNLGVNIYVAFCISGAVEIPSYVTSIFTMKYLGRKLSSGILMILAGLSCFATIPAPLGPVRATFAMIGKFAIAASFSNIYVHTAEILPTPLRTLGVGSCSIAARVGGIMAPLVLVLENIWGPLPLVLFASSSVLAGVLIFLLPETRGKAMPDTIADTLALKTPMKHPSSIQDA